MKTPSLRRAFELPPLFLALISRLVAIARPGLALTATALAAPLTGLSGQPPPGEVVAWGSGYWGATNVPDFGPAVAVSAGRYHSLALRSNGTVVAWGGGGSDYQEAGQVPAGLSNVVAIAAGAALSVALRADGTVVAWGLSGYTNVPPGLTDAVAVAAGGYHGLALRRSGQVVGWGQSDYGQITPPEDLTNAVAIAAGSHHSLALRADGTVVGFGYNGSGECVPPAGLANVTAIAAGQDFSLALRADGTVVAWGRGYFGETNVPPGLSEVAAISAGGGFALALRSNGTVVAWGKGAFGLTNGPTGLTNVLAIAAGDSHALALVPWSERLRLREALDAPELVWSTGGAVPWFAQTETTHDGTDAAAGRVEIVGDRSWIRTEVTGPGRLSFFWKCWTAWPTYDRLALYLDGDLLDSIPGGTDWEAAEFDLPDGPHTLRWVFEADSEPWPTYGAWLDEVTFTPAGGLDLAEALDAPGLVWTTGGAVPWFAQTDTTHDDVDAAQGTVNIMNDRSWLATTVAGPARLSFFWKCSTRWPEYDRLAFYIDDTLIASIPSDTDWEEVSLIVPPGERELKWVFEVDSEPTPGLYNAWLDEVRLDTNAVPVPPRILRQPAALAVPVGGDAVFTVAAEGTAPLRYQWQFNGADLPGATAATLVLTDVQPSQAGAYRVVVDNGTLPATSEAASLTLTPAPTTWTWARQGGGAGWVNGGGGVAVAPDGAVYVTGSFSEEGHFGPLVLTNNWVTRFFLAKYDSDGNILWVRTPASATYSASYGALVAVDAAGNAYAAGTFADAMGDTSRARIAFGPHAITNVGWFEDVFLVKYNPAGEPLWARRMGGPRQEFVYDLAVDAAGRAWITGGFGQALYDADGTLLWAQNLGGFTGSKLAVDLAGQACLSGRCASAVTLDGFTVGPGLFVLKYNPAAEVVWAWTGPANLTGPACALACDAAGALYLAGGFQGSVSFGEFTVTASDSNAVFLAKFSATGTAEWAREIASSAASLDAQHLFLDRAGQLYFVAGFEDILTLGGKPFARLGSAGVALAQLDAAGAQHWAVKWPAGAGTYGRAFAAGAAGRIFNTGQFGGTVAFGPHTLVCAGVNAMFLTRLDGNLTSRPAVATRQLPAVCQPGVAFAVRLQVTPDPATTAYALEDRPPAGWAVGNISDGGVFEAGSGKVMFGPFADNAARLLSYEVTPPPDVRGPHTFAGTVSCDGINTAIGGDTVIEPTPLPHPADLAPADSILTPAELDAYSVAWRQGQSWPVPPNPIPIAYLTRAAALAAAGGCYSLDASAAPPLCWVPGAASGALRERALVRAAAQTGSATGLLADRFVPGEPLPVTVMVVPEAGTAAFAVEDVVPPGWTVTAVSHGGEFIAAQRRVKWGPFLDGAPRQLTYTVRPPTEADGSAVLAGCASFDGANLPIVGQRQTTASGRLTVLASGQPAPFQFNLITPPGAILQIEASTNLADWTPLTLLTNLGGPLQFRDPAAPAPPRRFYRALLFR